MKINSLEMEWTDTGCVAKVIGMEGCRLACPRCSEVLASGVEHRCGDAVAQPKPKRKRQRKSDVS
jgi:pyruvate-formate lyase-activating enzyme